MLGLEEVTSFFHVGLGPSVAANSLNEAGHPTALRLDPARPLKVNYIMAMHDIPAGFDEVATIIEDGKNRVALRSRSGQSVSVPLASGFIADGKFP